jgi:hypothetical protein
MVADKRNMCSMAIHGCDHTKAEFGSRDAGLLNRLAKTAVERMEKHRDKYGVDYERIMIFPQGVFSKESLAVLKANNYRVAVNTDLVALDDEDGVPLEELLDLAIMKYSCFPLITRRYLGHGIENIAFDLFMGKPCLLVTHPADYGPNLNTLFEGIDAVTRLKKGLVWENLGDIVQSLCRQRNRSENERDVIVYSSESIVRNTQESTVKIRLLKRECDPGGLQEVTVNGLPVEWTHDGSAVSLTVELQEGGEARTRFVYKDTKGIENRGKSFLDRQKVRLRRHMTEIRDRYLS